jgi:hypothetical protein
MGRLRRIAQLAQPPYNFLSGLVLLSEAKNLFE